MNVIDHLEHDHPPKSKRDHKRRKSENKRLKQQLLQNDLDLNDLLKQMEADGRRST